MSTRAQQHKSKIAQITCALVAYALVPIQTAMGLTAGERFHALHNLDNGNVAKSGWFTTVMLLVLAGSIIALVIVTLYRKLHQGRKQKAEGGERKTEYPPSLRLAGAGTGQKTKGERQKTDLLPSGIEQRVSNIEKQVSAIEQRLTNLEQEVSSFEVIEDNSNAETQVLATINPGGSISGETK